MTAQNQALSQKSPVIVVDGAQAGLLAYYALNDLRYLDRQDRVLAMCDDADALFPDPAELEEQGADLAVLHGALTAGLSAQDLGDAIASGVQPSVLSRALELGLDPQAVSDLLSTCGGDLDGMLQNYVESQEDERYRPDVVSRTLARYGE